MGYVGVTFYLHRGDIGVTLGLHWDYYRDT